MVAARFEKRKGWERKGGEGRERKKGKGKGKKGKGKDLFCYMLQHHGTEHIVRS
jgi:hypothetical protein